MNKGHIETESLEDSERFEETHDGIEKKELDYYFASTYSLKPNENYEVNQYSYETDRYGRITHCEGRIHLEEGKRNTDHQVKAGGESRRETDDGGHLIATRFGGSGKIDNIVPMDKDLNRGEYKKIENDWAIQTEVGNNVDVVIKCKYGDDSLRPDAFQIKYKVTDAKGCYLYSEQHYIENK